MTKPQRTKYYPPLEEKINVFSHGIGFTLSIVAFALLLSRTIHYGDILQIVSAGIFGLSLMILYAASTLYHNSKIPSRRNKLKVFDHAAIFVLIAGTYTPFTLLILPGATGWIIFGASWGMALTGIILKLFFTGKYKLLSTTMYVSMGWMIVFAIKPLVANLPQEGLYWLFAGGISYTLGAILYSIKKIKFNHAIFHVFVLGGSFCHFMAIYFYVLAN
jgi:hemolysin III